MAYFTDYFTNYFDVAAGSIVEGVAEAAGSATALGVLFNEKAAVDTELGVTGLPAPYADIPDKASAVYGEGVASAAGVASADANGNAIVTGAGSSDGIATAQATGDSLAQGEAVAEASGSATVTGVGGRTVREEAGGGWAAFVRYEQSLYRRKKERRKLEQAVEREIAALIADEPAEPAEAAAPQYVADLREYIREAAERDEQFRALLRNMKIRQATTLADLLKVEQALRRHVKRREEETVLLMLLAA